MKKIKQLFIYVISFVLLFTYIILPIYAVETNQYLNIPPSDLGNILSINDSFTGLNKYYIVVDVNQYNSENVRILFYDNNNSLSTQSLYLLKIVDNQLVVNVSSHYTTYTNNMFIMTPIIRMDIESLRYYIPVYCYNSMPDPRYSYQGIRFYKSTADTPDIEREAFELGYLNGYNDGYDDGIDTAANVFVDLPLVEKLSTFLAQFTGEQTSQYITPLAICMILILIYCLFIRWILNLARSSKLTRLTDIVVLVSCIAILLIYYIPMIDFTINQNQVVETIYTIASDVNVGG